MLSSRTRLCSTCRHDLVSLFERGFCGPAIPRVAFGNRRRPPRLQRQTRWLSNSTRFYENERDSESPSQDVHTQHEDQSVLTEEELSARFEALQRLEEFDDEDSVLHESDEDQTNHKEVPVVPESSPVNVHPGAEFDALREQVNDYRAAGFDATFIAREARQIFGDYLPEDVLHEQELQIYTRLYGEPLPPAPKREEDANPVLLDEEGGQVSYTLDRPTRESDLETQELGLVDGGQVDVEAIDELDEDEGFIADPEFEDPFAEEPAHERQHPMTALGKFETSPRTLSMPYEQYTRPLTNVMASFNNKQLKDVCERTFGGPGLPDSPLTPRSGRGRQQVAVQLEAAQHFMGEMEATAFMTTVMPPAFAAISSTLVDARKRLGATWLTGLLAKEGGPKVLDAGAGGAGILAWNEIVRAHWNSLHSSAQDANPPPPTKAVVLTGSNPLRHRAAQLLDNTTFVPRLPDYVHTREKQTIDDDRPAQQRKQFDVIISSYSLLPFKEDWEKKQYVQNLWALLSSEGGVLIMVEKGIPRGFEAIAGARDLLLERYIATPPGQDTHYTALHKEAASEGNLWQPETGMIIGPCSNHERCPMYKIPGVSIGRKDICSFQQRYIRPGYLQRILGATTRNHDDVNFSYVSVVKGRDLRQSSFEQWSHIANPLSAPASEDTFPSTSTTHRDSNSESWLKACQSGWAEKSPKDEEASPHPPTHTLPRLVFPPIKRRGHAILDVCTPMGTIERWTVPRSFGKQAYRDARKAKWGDLWALGAKTRISRSIRQGSGKDKMAGILSGKLKGRGKEERIQNAAIRMRERAEQEQDEDHEEEMRITEEIEARAAEEDFEDDFTGGRRKPQAGSKRFEARQDAEEEAEMDELDWEIEQKLQEWEAELSDTRPTDRHGRVIKGGRKARGMRPQGMAERVMWQPAGSASRVEEEAKRG